MTTVTTNTDDAEAFRVMVDRQLLEREGAMPCVVHAVSADGTTVDVIPAISKAITLDGVRQPLGSRVIRSVPIMLYGSTSLGLFVCPPIQVGDDGWLMAADRAMDNWQYGEGVQMPPAQQTPRHGDFTDGVFYPGLQRASGAVANFPIDALTIQDRTGATVVSVKDGEIKAMVGGVSVTITAAGIQLVGPIAITGDLGQMGNQVINGTVTANQFIDV